VIVQFPLRIEGGEVRFARSADRGDADNGPDPDAPRS
jgi:hypothetical protein